MTVEALAKLRKTKSAWLSWLQNYHESHNQHDTARRLGISVDELLQWYQGDVVPPLCTRIGVVALLDDAEGQCDRKPRPMMPARPLPQDLDLTLPLTHLRAHYGGSLTRYVNLRKDAGIKIAPGNKFKKSNGNTDSQSNTR